MRVRVPFGSSTRIGVVIGEADRSDLAESRLRRVSAVLDGEPVLPAECVALVTWAAGYYHHPIGEVVSSMLPAPLRRGRTARLPTARVWRASEAGRRVGLDVLARAPTQRALLIALRGEEIGLSESSLAALARGWKRGLGALQAKGWVDCFEAAPSVGAGDATVRAVDLDPAQTEAVGAITRASGFDAFLLDGRRSCSCRRSASPRRSSPASGRASVVTSE
jgi:primosomal protein N' (replication factor Y)